MEDDGLWMIAFRFKIQEQGWGNFQCENQVVKYESIDGRSGTRYEV